MPKHAEFAQTAPVTAAQAQGEALCHGPECKSTSVPLVQCFDLSLQPCNSGGRSPLKTPVAHQFGKASTDAGIKFATALPLVQMTATGSSSCSHPEGKEGQPSLIKMGDNPKPHLVGTGASKG